MQSNSTIRGTRCEMQHSQQLKSQCFVCRKHETWWPKGGEGTEAPTTWQAIDAHILKYKARCLHPPHHRLTLRDTLYLPQPHPGRHAAGVWGLVKGGNKVPTGYHADQDRVVEGEAQGPCRKPPLLWVPLCGAQPIYQKSQEGEAKCGQCPFRMDSGRCQPFLLKRIYKPCVPQRKYLVGSKDALASCIDARL